MTDRSILAEAVSLDGARIELLEDMWLRDVVNPQSGQAELEPHVKAVLLAD